jgi:hypothetical protein
VSLALFLYFAPPHNEFPNPPPFPCALLLVDLSINYLLIFFYFDFLVGYYYFLCNI